MTTLAPARAERAAKVRELRAQDLTFTEIAERLGISKPYASLLHRDPTGEDMRAYKARYSRPCPGCGAALSGSEGHGPRAPQRCQPCAMTARLEWPPERMLLALRGWAATHGRPPKVSDTKTDPSLPLHSNVHKRFGSWNAGMRAAGLPTRRQGGVQHA